MATDGVLNALNASTKRFVRENPKLVDMIFHNDPAWAYARQTLREDFTGGRVIAEDFTYRGLIGGSYLPGKEFNIAERQVEQQAQFEVAYYEVNITLTKETVKVLNKGPAASYRLVDSRTSIAYETLGAFIAISMYLNRQDANFGPLPNGLTEAVNDGSTASWNGNSYATYGGLNRADATGGNRLVSRMTDVAGAEIEYNTLTESYEDACFGTAMFEPNVGITTHRGYTYIEEKFQTQQRFQPVTDTNIGFPGMKFKNATLFKSRYAPGSYIADTTTDANETAVDYLTETTGDAVTAYPALATANSETLWWMNFRKPFANLYVTNDDEYGFGMTGWKPGQGNTKIANQVLAGLNFTFVPRYHHLVFNFVA